MNYNILSLDGGGSWAILEARALGELFGCDTPGHEILARFHFAAANSGGSIVLAGLAANFSPQCLFDLLNNEPKRKTIFVKNFITLAGLERYNAAAKLPGLRAIFKEAGDKPLNQTGLDCKLLISAFDYNRRRAQFFRSDADSPAASAKGPQPTLAEAVHASTNAPIKYFDAPAEFKTEAFAGERYWDGGVGGFNNPAMAAVIEALAYGHNAGDLRVLSIGTGSVFLPMPNRPFPAPGSPGQNPLCVTIDTPGLYHDINLVTTAIIDDPPDQASFVAHLVTSGAGALSQDPAKPVTAGNLVRLNPWIQPIKTPAGWSPPPLRENAAGLPLVVNNYEDDNDAFDALVNLDMDAVEQSEVDLINALGNAWIANKSPNQLIRATSDLRPLIGHATFSAAVAQAKTLGLVGTDV